ncbi:DUF3991 and toprim domain-containing protein [Bengtsoniella intestinalis]|uniref:DUF3991 and toprim domain-containing protein n=1 Tax=Bengtsoniella intestinalis TaxID=3073143 RepID=UPI00391F7D68
MGKYIHFTEEEKNRANEVDLVDFLRYQGERLVSSGREKRLTSNHSITVRGNEWYDHATERGGYAIDFVKSHYGLSFPDAVLMLLGGEQKLSYRPASEKPIEKKPFALPPPNRDMRRVYAYLIKSRHLSREVVHCFAQANLLYESRELSADGMTEYHNAIFVGVDEAGIPRHAHKRGLYTEGKGFKGNVEGSSPAHCFHYVGSSDHLYVFEAPIDMLSFLTLYPQSWQDHSYVSLCGVGSQSMLWMLETYPHLQTVALCLDNDTPGHKASSRLETQLQEQGYTVERCLSQGKDWNEDISQTTQLAGYSMEMR